MEAAAQNVVEMPQPTFEQNLAAFIEANAAYQRLKGETERAKEECDRLRELCKAEFERMGVSSMKTRGQTVYIAHQIWAGTAQGVDTAAVVDELKDLGLGHHINYNHQSFSAYVREVAREHPELMDEKGNIIAEPVEILAVLPGRLAQLCAVTDKMDLKIRKS